MINKDMLRDPDLLDPTEIAVLLPVLDEFIEWATKVQEYALKQALNGTEIPGYKLVEGKTKRRITDEDAAVKALVAAGYNEALLYERKLLALTKLESLVTKKKFAQIVGDYVEKPKGAPALVPEDDPREPYKTDAAKDFGDGFGENFD